MQTKSRRRINEAVSNPDARATTAPITWIELSTSTNADLAAALATARAGSGSAPSACAS